MNAPNTTKVLIVDDHAMVRSGLRLFLLVYDDLELVGEGTNGSDAVNLAGAVSPDVILMDLIMPSMDGIQATREIHRKYPNIKIIALTSFTDPELIHDAIEAGVSGYLFKNASANELANAIRSVVAGNTIFSPEVTQSLLSYESSAEIITELTSREKDVLSLMAAGKSNTEISKTLVIELTTVKYHVSHILTKLNAHSRGEAVSIAIKKHLV